MERKGREFPKRPEPAQVQSYNSIKPILAAFLGVITLPLEAVENSAQKGSIFSLVVYGIYQLLQTQNQYSLIYFLNNSSIVFPSLFFHSVQPLARLPKTVAAAVLGDPKT